MMRSVYWRLGTSAVAAALLSSLAACGAGDDTEATADSAGTGADDGASGDTLTIYSGRNEELVSGILDNLEETTGHDVEVRYGDSAEMAAQILEEGENTNADLFFAQDAGALGALSDAGMLRELPQEELNEAPERFRAQDGSWVATSARARVVVYDPEQVEEEELPDTIDELVEPEWEGSVGYAPTNASWQAFVTAVRVLEGEEAARDWLTRFEENDPEPFENNTAILEAVDSGDVPLGLINHYYYYAMVSERGEDNVNAQLHFADGGDPLALANVAGVGVLDSSDSADAAVDATRFLLSGTAQQYFADETAEHAVREGITSNRHDMPPLDELDSPEMDLSELSSLDETLRMLQEVGLA